MAKLEPHFPLSDVDASNIIGLRTCDKTVVVTANRRVVVIDVATRRVTHSFPAVGEPFSSPAVAITDSDGATRLLCCVGDDLWSWSIEADDLKNDVDKIHLPFPCVDASAFPEDDVVAVVSADGRVAVVNLSDKEIVEIVGSDEGSSTSASNAKSAAAEVVDGRLVTLDLSENDEGVVESRFRLFDLSSKSVASFSYSISSSPSACVFLRRNSSLCLVADGKIVSIQFETDRGGEVFPVGRAIGETDIGEESKVVWIDPSRDVFFCATPNSVEMRSLKFGTVVGTQPLTYFRGLHFNSAICCTVAEGLCAVSDNQLVCFPFTFPDSSATLSAHFGKKQIEGSKISDRNPDSEASEASDAPFGNTPGWQRHRKRFLKYGEEIESDKRRSLACSPEVSTKLTAALSSDSAAAELLAELRDGAETSRLEIGKIFESLVELIASKKGSDKDAIVWPGELFRFLMSSCIVARWDQVVDSLIQRSDLSSIDVALRQPGIDAANVCRLLRFVVSLPNDGATAGPAGSGDLTPTVDKRHLLLRIVTFPVRDEDAKKVLKSVPVGEVTAIIETFLELIKDEANSSEGEREEEEEEEEDIEDVGKPFSSSLPNAALLHWITLLVDSHFLDFIMGNDEKYFRLLVELEAHTHDLETYFQTRDALDGLLGDMKERLAVFGESDKLKTKMGPTDDYCIQVMEF